MQYHDLKNCNFTLRKGIFFLETKINFMQIFIHHEVFKQGKKTTTDDGRRRWEKSWHLARMSAFRKKIAYACRALDFISLKKIVYLKISHFVIFAVAASLGNLCRFKSNYLLRPWHDIRIKNFRKILMNLNNLRDFLMTW